MPLPAPHPPCRPPPRVCSCSAGAVLWSHSRPQSKDLEQQLQEELLEVVSELQTVRTGPGLLLWKPLQELAVPSHITPPQAGLEEEERVPRRELGFGDRRHSPLSALGTRWLGRALTWDWLAPGSESQMAQGEEGEAWL